MNEFLKIVIVFTLLVVGLAVVYELNDHAMATLSEKAEEV